MFVYKTRSIILPSQGSFQGKFNCVNDNVTTKKIKMLKKKS